MWLNLHLQDGVQHPAYCAVTTGNQYAAAGGRRVNSPLQGLVRPVLTELEHLQRMKDAAHEGHDLVGTAAAGFGVC